MTTCYWRCTGNLPGTEPCGAAGEGERAAEKHVKDTAHSVLTSARSKTLEGVLADRYWLTEAGYAALEGRKP